MPSLTTFDRIGLAITATDAPSNLHLGIYDLDAEGTGVCSDLILDIGAQSVSGSQNINFTIDQTLAPGWYCLAVEVDSSTVTVKAHATARRVGSGHSDIPGSTARGVIRPAHTYTGALPDPFPAVTTTDIVTTSTVKPPTIRMRKQ